MRCDYLRPEIARCSICNAQVEQLGESYCSTCEDIIDHLADVVEERAQELLDKATHRRGW